MALTGARSKGRLLAAVSAALLAIGLLWGITSAMASSDSPSPAAGKTILRLGWTNDPDNLNPFIGYESSSSNTGVIAGGVIAAIVVIAIIVLLRRRGGRAETEA